MVAVLGIRVCAVRRRGVPRASGARARSQLGGRRCMDGAGGTRAQDQPAPGFGVLHLFGGGRARCVPRILSSLEFEGRTAAPLRFSLPSPRAQSKSKALDTLRTRTAHTLAYTCP